MVSMVTKLSTYNTVRGWSSLHRENVELSDKRNKQKQIHTVRLDNLVTGKEKKAGGQKLSVNNAVSHIYWSEKIYSLSHTM